MNIINWERLRTQKRTIYEKFTQEMTILHKERRKERWNNGMMEYWNDELNTIRLGLRLRCHPE